MSYWYVGSPYSKYALGIDRAYEDICREVARLLMAGVPCFSPIAHCHGIAKHGDIDPLSHHFWLEADEALMKPAVGMLIVELFEWDKSHGLLHERRRFMNAKKPVINVKPGWKTLPQELIDWLKTQPVT